MRSSHYRRSPLWHRHRFIYATTPTTLAKSHRYSPRRSDYVPSAPSYGRVQFPLPNPQTGQRMATVVLRKSRSGYRADIRAALLLERVYNVERGFGRRKAVVLLSKEDQIVDMEDGGRCWRSSSLRLPRMGLLAFCNYPRHLKLEV